jgi:hypothetical protein
MATLRPHSIYIRAILRPNIPNSITRATSLTMGEEIKNEKVTPKGTPASINPMNTGIAEQLQKGVTIPSRAATTLPRYWWRKLKIFRVFSGGKKLRIIATTKIIRASMIKIFKVS